MTYGEILPGAIIDLVPAADRDALDSLLSNGKEKPLIAPMIEFAGVYYHPPSLHPSILAAVPFLRGVAEYGDVSQLFGAMGKLHLQRASSSKVPLAESIMPFGYVYSHSGRACL